MLNTNADKGAIVTEVNPGGPAEKAGIKVGDVITMVNGDPVIDASSLQLKVWYNKQVGSRFKFDIDRSGSPITADYLLIEPPPENGKD